MEYSMRDVQGQRFIEGAPGQQLIGQADDVRTVLEACFEHGVESLLLYPENLTPQFFDLSSGEAGAILQKLRMYHIRVAVVRPPTQRLSHRFVELMVEENRGPYFRLFDERSAAQEWLCFG